MSDGWRFAIVADTHLGQATSAGVHNPVSADHLAARFAALGDALAGCDFVLHLGDVVDNGTAEEIGASGAMMRRWPCPVYVCLGNHDARTAGQREQWPALFGEGFPNAGEELQFSLTHRGVHLAVLQSSWIDAEGDAQPYWVSGQPRWMLSEAQLAWLDADLAAHATRPTIVAHHPLSLPLTARLNGAQDAHVPEPEPVAALQAVLARHRQVKVLAGGHAHAHQIEWVETVCHVSTGCISEYPYEYRIVEVGSDTWTITTSAWPVRDAGMIEPSAARTPWVAGQEQDRVVVVRLSQ